MLWKKKFATLLPSALGNDNHKLQKPFLSFFGQISNCIYSKNNTRYKKTPRRISMTLLSWGKSCSVKGPCAADVMNSELLAEVNDQEDTLQGPYTA